MCSLHAHANDILNDYDTMSTDIICLQELFSLPCNTDILFGKYNNHSMYHIHGITILTSRNLFVTNSTEHRSKNIEAITITVNESDYQLNVCNFYVQAHTTIAEIKISIDEIATSYISKNKLYIVGDFNIDMSTQNITTTTLMKHMQKYNIQFMLNQTHNINKPLIDHVWTNSPASTCSIYKTQAY